MIYRFGRPGKVRARLLLAMALAALSLVSLPSCVGGSPDLSGQWGWHRTRNVRFEIIKFTQNAMRLERERKAAEKQYGLDMPRFSTFSVDYLQKYGNDLSAFPTPPEAGSIRTDLLRFVDLRRSGEIDKSDELLDQTYKRWAELLWSHKILAKEEGWPELVSPNAPDISYPKWN